MKNKVHQKDIGTIKDYYNQIRKDMGSRYSITSSMPRPKPSAPAPQNNSLQLLQGAKAELKPNHLPNTLLYKQFLGGDPKINRKNQV